MPILDDFKNRMEIMGSYEGVRRDHAQKIMEASFLRDAATKPVYVKWVNSGLPSVSDSDSPVYAKFNVKSYHNITGDEIAYLLQFRQKDLAENENIKVGSYVYMPNEIGELEWWLIVHFDDRPMFRQFSILKCAWTYRWVSEVDGKRRVYECLGAPRKQNSYNSGVWLDYITQTVENQEVMWLPDNLDTKTIFYDTKFLKSSPGRYPPLAWKVSKIEDTATEGISKFTMTQEQFDPARDNPELMIANYYEYAVEPELPNPDAPISDLEIVYSGLPAVRAGGGYKKFMLKTRIYEELIDVTENVQWEINFSDGNLDKLEYSAEDNVFMVKCLNDYSLIGKTFVVTATSNNTSKSITVEVISL